MKKLSLLTFLMVPILLLLVIYVGTTIAASAQTHFFYVESVNFDTTSYTFYKTEDNNMSFLYPATVYPKSATDKLLHYTSSNESVAIIDNFGMITVFDFGTTVFRAVSNENSEKYAECEFKVTDSKIRSVKFNISNTTLNIDEKINLSWEVKPSDIENKKTVLTISNNNVVNITYGGIITAVGEGDAIIKISSAENPNVFDEIKITVVIPAENIQIASTQILTAKNIIDISDNLTILPLNATNKEVVYTCSNRDIAVVKSDGRVYFSTHGKVEITATIPNSTISASFSVTSTNGGVSSITLFPQTLEIDYEKNKIIELDIFAVPQDFNVSNLVYQTSNNAVVKVENNKLLVVNGGICTITVCGKNENNQDVYDYCEIKINKLAECINILNATYNIDKEKYEKTTTTKNFVIKTQILPTDCTDKNLFFELLNDASVATVNDNGLVNFQKEGIAQIRVYTQNQVAALLEITYLNQANNILIENNLIDLNEDVQVEVYYGSLYYFIFNDFDDYNIIEYYLTAESEVLSINNDVFETIKGGIEKVKVVFDSIERFFTIKVIRLAEDISIDVEGFELNNNYLLSSKTVFRINCLPIPADSTNKTVIFSSLNSEIATVDSTGGVVFNKNGQVELLLVIDEIEKILTIESTFGKIKNFEIDVVGLVIENVGETYKINLTSFEPFDLNIASAEITAFSNNNDIASIDDEWNVTGIAKGNTSVVLKIDNITKMLNIEVKVKVNKIAIFYNAEEISFKQTLLSEFNLYEKYNLTTYPQNANNSSLNFESYNTSIATISPGGTITFIKDGKVQFLIWSDDGAELIVEFEKIKDIQNFVVLYMNENVSQITTQDLSNELPFSVIIAPESVAAEFNYLALNIYHTANTDFVISIFQEQNIVYFNYIYSGLLSTQFSLIISYESCIYEVNIKIVRIESITIEKQLTDYDRTHKVGLKNERVFGVYSAETINATLKFNTFYQISYSVSPLNLADKIYWHLSENEFVTSIINGRLTFKSQSAFNYKAQEHWPLIVTITDNESIANSHIIVSYTYKFVLGNNVKNMIELIAAKNGKPNNLDLPLVLQANFGTNEDKISGLPFVEMTDSGANDADKIYVGIYGNGYTLNFHNISKRVIPDDDITITFYNKTTTQKLVENVKIKIKNDSTNAKDFKNEFRLDCNNEVACFTLNYCIVENTLYGIRLEGSQCVIKNTVIRNTPGCGITVFKKSVYNTYVENLIIYNVGLSGITLEVQSSNINLYVKGFLDVYDFKTAADYIGSNLSLITVANRIINNNPDFTYNYNLKKYANCAISLIYEPEKYSTYNVYFWNDSTNIYVKDVESHNYFGKIEEKYSGILSGWKELKVHMYLTNPKYYYLTPSSSVNLSKIQQ